MHQFVVEPGYLESSSAEENLRQSLVDTKLNMSPQSTFEANKADGILGCVRSEELILPFYLALVRPHQEFCVQFWSPQYRREMKLLERGH